MKTAEELIEEIGLWWKTFGRKLSDPNGCLGDLFFERCANFKSEEKLKRLQENTIRSSQNLWTIARVPDCTWSSREFTKYLLEWKSAYEEEQKYKERTQ